MRKKKLTSLIVLVFVLLCNCDYFKSLCEPENDPKKQPTTLQNIVNNATDGEIINLEEWENVTDYTATIDKKLTIKSGNLNGASLTVKAENVKLEKMQNLSVETSSRLTIKDSKLNNLLLGGNAQSRSNTTAEINVILENCEIAEKIKINSKAKLNIAGEKTKIAKIVVAVVETLCKIFCADELDTTEIKDIVVDEDNKKLENVKVSKAYKITYHSNCDELEDIEDFFSPDDGTISLPTDIFKRNGYIFAGWYYDNNQAVEDSINVSDKTADINVYAGWTKYIPGSGVYKYSINIEDIPESGPWNGSRTSPAFSILLLTDKLVEASIKHGDFYFSNDAYQIQTRASENLRITDTSKTGNYAVYGEVPTNIDSIPENDKYKYYSGVAATVTDTTLEIFVDMSKIVKTELKVFRKSESSTAQEEFVTENTLIDLTDYKPYIIALGTKGSLFTSLTWDADLMAMTGNATFPTNLQQSAPTTGNTNSVTVTDNNNNTETINFSELSTKLSTLSAGTYTLKVSGGITNNTITEIANAMNSNTEAKINLDLSDTDGLTEIPKKSFQFCNNLISINIPKSVTIISSQSFEDSGLTSVMLPNNLQNIENHAFFKCSNLASIEIPDSVTTISTYAFYNCSSLTSVTFNNTNNWYYTNNENYTGGTAINVTDTAQNADNLKDTYSEYYWYRPTELTATADTVAATIRNLSAGTYMLKVSGEITSATITAIANAMNSNTEAKINLDLSGANGVTTIDDYAFFDCSSLTSVTIGNGVTSIGAGAFSYCSGLTSVTFNNTNNWYYTNNENYTGGTAINVTDTAQNANNLKDTYSEYYWYRPTELTATADTVAATINGLSAGTYTLKVSGEITSTTITTIATAMNSNTEAKINLDLSGANGLTEIPENAFCDKETYNGCTSLLSINIPDNVTTIGDYAFSDCSSLTRITIPNSVTSIGYSAFSCCLSLTSIEIPNSVTTIGSNAFYYCENLTSVTFNNTSDWYYTNNSDFTGGEEIVVTDPAQNAENLKDTYSGYYWYRPTELTATADNVESTITGLSTGTYTLKVTGAITNDTITTIATAMNNNTKAKINLDLSGTTELNEIPENAFYIDNTLNDNLISIIIPDSVTSIGEYAFRNCNITSVTIGSGVTSIGSGAFTICSKLKEVIISNNIKIEEIKDYAFSNCYNLTGFTIPSCLASIGNGAFNYCSNLTKFEVDTSNPNYSSSDDGTILLNKDKTVLIAYPSAKDNVTIPSGVTSIADGAFQYCSNLTNVTIPDGVKSIGEYAFSDCSSLTSVTIGNGVTSIGASAFSFCSGLTSIEIPNSVTTIGNYAFSDCSSLTSVTFEDTTSTWYYTDSENYTGGQTISVTNATENATYLKETYYDKYWYKENSVAGTIE